MKNVIVRNNVSEYLAKDMGLCSALYITSGIKLLRLEKDSTGFTWFIFSNKTQCESIAKRYWFDSLIIKNAKAYNDARKSLMDKLHSQPNDYA